MPRRSAPKRITKFKMEKIDRVGAGAQKDAHITLVKSRAGARIRVEKLIDPASNDAKIQAVRDEFREQYSNDYGCCSPCSGWVYVDAVYDDFVIACDSDGDYWKFAYTQDATSNDVTFEAPESMRPSVTWSPGDDDEGAPVPVAKSLWQADPAERLARRREEPKEHDMPAAKKTPVAIAKADDVDLSALDDETRAQVEATIAERDELRTAANAAEANVVVDDADEDDLGSVEGIRKAIKKSRGENRKVLEAVLTRVEKTEESARDDRERAVRLEKAERRRTYISKAEGMPHIAAHFETDADAKNGTDELANVLDDVERAGGADLATKVEKALAAANSQAVELARTFQPRGRADATDMASRARLTKSDTSALQTEFDEAVVAIKKTAPELSDQQAEVRVMNADPRFREIYAESAADSAAGRQ